MYICLFCAIVLFWQAKKKLFRGAFLITVCRASVCVCGGEITLSLSFSTD